MNLVRCIGVVLALGRAVAVSAQNSPRVSHQDLPSPLKADAPLSIGDTNLPGAIAAGDRWLPKPQPTENQPLAAQRAPRAQLDRQTDYAAPGTYGSVFNPDVVPYKRLSAFDLVSPDLALTVASTARSRLPVGGKLEPTRDRFWGDVQLTLSGETPVALPSVAPDMRVLSFEITPPVSLIFEKDSADNFTVRAAERTAVGTYRLVFVADADARYFTPPDPPSMSANELSELVPAALRRSLPPIIQREAMLALGTMRITAEQPLSTSLPALVEWFRAFEQKPLQQTTDNSLRDILRERVGVCRHRAFAFMVLASAMGLPVRMVENEAHAFVEVWLPAGWQRIDLGGATSDFTVVGGRDRTLHRPRYGDPTDPTNQLARTGLPTSVRGLSSQQLDDQRAGTEQAASGEAPIATPRNDQAQTRYDPSKPTPSVTLQVRERAAYRGETITVYGRVWLENKALTAIPVDVFLLPESGGDPIYLGRTEAAEGSYAATLKLPAGTPLERYEVVASVPMSMELNAGRSP